MKYGYNVNGALLTLLRSVKISVVSKPDGYTAKAATAIMDEQQTALAQQYPEKESYNKPNVIGVMCESFTDLTKIGNGQLETNVPVLPFYYSLEENTIKGWTYTNMLGGGTANSEFEFFTGNSMSFLPINASPYQLYMKSPQPSLVSTLEAQGYKGNTAIHPYRRDGYSRIRAYEMLGFEEFLGEEDFENPLMKRQFISDEANYEKLIDIYEQTKQQYPDDPVFLWTITMQNHSTYTKDYDNFDVDVHVTTPIDATVQGEHNELDKMLSLFNDSDEAIKELVEYFENVDEPTVIVFFGDHQPKLQEAFYDYMLGDSIGNLTAETLMQKYRTPFFIWANYDIEEAQYEHVSMNYLSSLMLDAAGMQMTDYNEYLLNQFGTVPCMTVYGLYDEAGIFYNTESKIQNEKNVNPNSKVAAANSTPYDSMLQEYNMIEYNNLIDPKKRDDSFFYLGDFAETFEANTPDLD
jgi:phosphoglycerol transferase MdoB-like AlkP superfamily enzyme